MSDILLVVGLTLLLALVLGEIVERVGQPGLLGEIAAGVLLGPHALGLLDTEGPFALFATVGAVLLFFDVGYEEIDLGELVGAGGPATVIAVVGMVLPAVVGVGVGLTFDYDLGASLFLGLLLAVTSIAVTVRTLMHLDRMDTTFGVRIVGAAVIDDVVGLLGLSVLLLLLRGDSLVAIGGTLGQIGLFFGGAILFAWVVDHISGHLTRSVQRGADFLAIMGIVFVFAYVAEAVGLATSIGALIAGLIVGSETRFDSIAVRESVVGVSYGLFIPLFFASIGASLDLGLVVQLDTFILVVVIGGIVTKVLGGYLGNRLVGGGHAESVTVGAGLAPKSEVGLAIVGIGLTQGIVDRRILSAYLVLMLVSILVTPPLLEWASGRVRTATG